MSSTPPASSSSTANRGPNVALIVAIVIPLLTVLFVVVMDDDDKPKVPPATGTNNLMSIDGIDITFADVEPMLEFLRSTNPDAGHKTVVRAILETYLIPLAFAERAFGQERALLLERAEGVRAIATNIYELDQVRDNVEIQERRKYTRLQPDLPVAAYLFNRLNEGGVSQPIAVPRGYVLAGTHDYTEVPIAGEDMVEATQVGFFTHKVIEWKNWIDGEKTRTADRVTYVHPDYRDALPSWCTPPKRKGK